MKKLCVLKIGGSVITNKDSQEFTVREKLLLDVFRALHETLTGDPDLQLMLVHGAGGHIHSLADQYNLREGTAAHKKGKEGLVKTKVAIQKLHTKVMKLIVAAGLPAVSFHTGSLITQKHRSIDSFDTKLVESALKEGYVPVLYGEMVFDSAQGVSVCSGDAIVAHLARTLPVTDVYFATDVDGVYSKDPHREKSAELIEKLSIREALSGMVHLTDSHNRDVTGGLRGKVEACRDIFRGSVLKKIEVFNGLKAENFIKALTGKPLVSTVIKK